MTASGRNTPQGAGGWRRVVAIIALVGGLCAAYWQSSKGTNEIEVTLLLTHVALPSSDAASLVPARAKLVEVELLVPRTADGDEIGWQHTVRFTHGAAPKATQPLTIKVPSDASELRFRCAYTLQPGSVPLHTRGRASVDPSRDKLQVVDVGTCAEL
jgi:hypothetical protein